MKLGLAPISKCGKLLGITRNVDTHFTFHVEKCVYV